MSTKLTITILNEEEEKTSEHNINISDETMEIFEELIIEQFKSSSEEHRGKPTTAGCYSRRSL